MFFEIFGAMCLADMMLCSPRQHITYIERPIEKEKPKPEPKLTPFLKELDKKAERLRMEPLYAKANHGHNFENEDCRCVCGVLDREYHFAGGPGSIREICSEVEVCER